MSLSFPLSQKLKLPRIPLSSSISEKGSIQLAQQSFGPEGGRLILLLPTPSESELPRPDVKTNTTLAYFMLGKPVAWGTVTLPAQPEDRACFSRWTKKTTELFAKGDVKVRCWQKEVETRFLSLIPSN